MQPYDPTVLNHTASIASPLTFCQDILPVDTPTYHHGQVIRPTNEAWDFEATCSN